MTRKGHIATGWGAAAIAYAFAHRFGQPGLAWLAALCALPGATAPDWLEISLPRGGTLITHRTWTHYLPFWLAALAYAYTRLPHAWWASALFGFVAGGLMHLIVDLPNPLGIPVVFPTRGRFSLNLWKCGKMEMPLIAAAFAAGAYSLHYLRVFA